jgi:hypothetical protein
VLPVRAFVPRIRIDELVAAGRLVAVYSAMRATPLTSSPAISTNSLRAPARREDEAAVLPEIARFAGEL